MLKNRGDHDKADKAGAGLPDQVDTDQHSNLGVDPVNLVSDAGLGGKIGL